MPDLLDHIERIFGGTFQVERSDIQNARRLSLKHLDQAVTIDLFRSGSAVVGGTNCDLKEQIEGHLAEYRKNPSYFNRLNVAAAKELTPKEDILRRVSPELVDFLPEHDMRALVAAYQVLHSELDLADYSPVTMPIGRVYEGFLGETLVRIGILTKMSLQDPSYTLMNALDSRDAKAFHAKVSTHQSKLESAKQRLKEFRHIQLHSQSSQFVQSKTRTEATQFAERVLGDMQALWDYFKNYFV